MWKWSSRDIIFLCIAIPGITMMQGCTESEAQPVPEVEAAPISIEWFFDQLDSVRDERASQIVAYLDTSLARAEGILQDPLFMDVFRKRAERHAILTKAEEAALEIQYVTNYGEFYDILFIDRSGAVFFSMLREADWGLNILTGPLSETRLAQSLPALSQVSFVDFEHYPPSSEPAAFFIVPVPMPHDSTLQEHREQADVSGWIVLQCPLNRIKAILTDRRGFGRTGEAYLVNEQHRMITESRFSPDIQSLQLMADTAATEAAFRGEIGHRVITDYRDVPVLSSYRAIEWKNVRWALLTEMDEAEIITELYRQDAARLCPILLTDLAKQIPHPAAGHAPLESSIRVDVNEFAKTSHDRTATTSGVATCTALAVVLPGELGYLAHIGPTDRIYGQADLGYNNCVGEMLNRISQHDIRPCQLSELQFTLIAAHDKSFASTVDLLLDFGVELSQIRFAYSPLASYANVHVTATPGDVLIEWFQKSGEITYVRSSDLPDLGSLIKHQLQQ